MTIFLVQRMLAIIEDSITQQESNKHHGAKLKFMKIELSLLTVQKIGHQS